MKPKIRKTLHVLLTQKLASYLLLLFISEKSVDTQVGSIGEKKRIRETQQGNRQRGKRRTEMRRVKQKMG